MWEELAAESEEEEQDQERESPIDFDFLSLLSNPKLIKLSDPCVPPTFPASKPWTIIHLNDFIWRMEHGDYYRILEVDYDATEETVRSNYIRLALKWHPDKKKGEESSTSRFQEINEAYKVLSDPTKRREYDRKGVLHVLDYNVMDYLNRYKGLILTCNGLGTRYSVW